MAEATIELRDLLKTDFKLFDFEYTFDDPGYREELEAAVTDYFYFYEIGQETPDRFKHAFRTRWQRIIPYYNQLYNTTLLNYDPLITHKLTETMKQVTDKKGSQDVTGKTTTKSDGSSQTNLVGHSEQGTVTDSLSTTDSVGKTDDYPQDGSLAGNYLSGANEGSVTSDSQGTQTTTGDTTSGTTSESHDTGSSTVNSGTTINDLTNNDYTRTVESLTGTTYQELIRQERANILRITEQVIFEMKPCFYLIY